MSRPTQPSPSGRRRRLQRRLAYGLAIGGAATLLLAALRGTRLLRVAEWKTYDARVQALADSAAASPDIVFIDIDENSLEAMRDQLGRWPWRRDAHAMLLAYARAAGARAVVFDVFFTEPDLRDPGADSALAEHLETDGRTVLALTFGPAPPGRAAEAVELERKRAAEDPELGRALELLPRFALPVSGPSADPADWSYVEPPTALLLERAAAVGSVNSNPDADGVARWEELVYDHRGTAYPSLALATARLLEPDRFGGPITRGPGELRVGAERIPVASDGRMLLRWHGPYRVGQSTTYPVYPAFHVLNSFDQVITGRPPDVPMAAFKDKVVFVGVTGLGTAEFDVRPTPLTAKDPGVILHAVALDNLLQGDPARRASAATNLVVLALAGVGTGFVTAGLGGATAATAAFLLLAAGLAGAALLALSQGVWLDWVAPSFAAALAFAGSMVANYVTEGREKRRVKELFSRYVSPEYVRRLADDFESLRLGGDRTEITILFSDIRGFTSISERLPAAQVIEMLNEYLERMSDVVFRHGGTLDKFIGDAVMAFWGAPIPVADHARRALETALDMLAELDALNARWAAAGAPAQLAIGVGINTGEAIVGNIGSLTRKLDYTAIGDAVNLASRLESLNKELGTTVLVSENAMRSAGEGFHFRPMSAVTVKGKTQAVNVFALEGRSAPSPTAGARGSAAAAGALVLALVAGTLAAAPLSAQSPAPSAPATARAPAAQGGGRARWTDWIYRPGRWNGTTLVPLTTTDQNVDSLALLARVEVYSLPPRWRLEFQRTTNGVTFEAPLVVVGGSGAPVVLTELGSAPLAEHVAWQDSVVRLTVESFRPDGRILPPAPARVVRATAGGVVRQVVLRKAVARAEFPDELLGQGTVGRLGRSLGRLGIQAVGGERRTDVVASAGARGVARVRTVNGEILVNPDTAAVKRLDARDVDLMELERFMRDLSAPSASGGQ